MPLISKKYEMPVQPPKERAKNFREVALGYDEETALLEAGRCLNCKNRPCVAGCPVNIEIPDFIAKIRKKDYEAAYEIISRSSSLPAVCGRVCPQENQCEGKCTMGIKNEPVAIGRLERFVADRHNAGLLLRSGCSQDTSVRVPAEVMSLRTGCPHETSVMNPAEAMSLRTGCPQETSVMNPAEAMSFRTMPVIPNQGQSPCVMSLQSKLTSVCASRRFGIPMAESTSSLPEGIPRFARNDIKEARNNINEVCYDKKIAIVGSGPSGLTCAGDLAKKGYSVTVFEALHKAGGVLVYGIPEFRLPKKIVEREIEGLKALGVDIQTNVIIGKTLMVEELFDMGYEAVYIASGAGLPRFMNIPGEGLNGVYSANEFLTRSNLMKAYIDHPVTPIMKGGKVAVVGGGNVAMDAARTALRLGAEKVSIIYRRTMDELPARKEEVEHAKEEGIEFLTLCAPVEILGYENKDNPKDYKNGFVSGIKCVRMELGEPGADGRRRPHPLEGSEFVIDVTAVVIAIGTSPNPLIKNTTAGLEVNEKGGIIIDKNRLTTILGVYAGGDVVTGSATVISAMGAGKLAAEAIDEYLRSL